VNGLGEPGAGAELVDHLGAVLERLTRVVPAADAPGGGRDALRGSRWADFGADRGGASPPPADPHSASFPPTDPHSASGDFDPMATQPVSPPDANGRPDELLALLDAELTSRWLDVAARRLRAAGRGVPHEGSAGREGVAAVALALRSTDPVLPAYPPGAFHLARAALAGRRGAVADLAFALTTGDQLSPRANHLSISPAAPAATAQFATAAPAGGATGGSSGTAATLPTAPGAGHLPRALGVAWALGRQLRSRARDRVSLRWPDDALAVGSFVAADANHSTVIGTINAASWAAQQGLPLPLLLVCEDDGGSGPVRLPRTYLRAAYERRAGLRYRFADTAGDPGDVLATAREAADLARAERVPVILHLACANLLAGEAELAADPLVPLLTALVRRGVIDGPGAGALFLDARDRVSAAVDDVVQRPNGGRREVPAGPVPRPDPVAEVATRAPDAADRAHAFPAGLPEDGPPITLAASLGSSLLDAGLAAREVIVLGADVARRGGRFGVTEGLQRRLGAARVLDTLPDEEALLGLALGAGASGLLPVVELPHVGALQRVAAQLRVEANGVPLVVRVPWFAGVPTEDVAAADLGIGMLRDQPGLLVACPAHPSDGPGILRTCLAAAQVDGVTAVLLEPVALYHERDMVGTGDRAWLAAYPAPGTWPSVHVPVGRASVWGSGTDVTIVAFGTGLRRSLRAAEALGRIGIGARVVDLRWLAPLPVDDVVREADLTGRMLIVDETRRTGGVSEGLVTSVLEAGFGGRLARITSSDVPGRPGIDAARQLPTQNEIEDTARALCAGGGAE
jgi:2-oxoisovalerate dehydrogenase E1 component